MESIRESVKEYYGKVLSTKQDLKTTACCAVSSPGDRVASVLQKIHPDIHSRCYGCGFPFPENLSNQTILDLGCGTGRDVFALAALAGRGSTVIGIDMTPEQLDTARSFLPYHQEAFSYQLAEIEFRSGLMEDTGLEESSVDLVVSNCVFNLSPIKPELYEEIKRVLKPGGRVFFSDVFSSEPLPDWAMHDDILLGECLGGAITTNELTDLITTRGFSSPEILSKSKIGVTDSEVANKLPGVVFSSCLLSFNKLSENP